MGPTNGEPGTRSPPLDGYAYREHRSGAKGLGPSRPIFLRSNAVEVEIDGSKYLIVPHAAVLLLIRDRIPLP